MVSSSLGWYLDVNATSTFMGQYIGIIEVRATSQSVTNSLQTGFIYTWEEFSFEYYRTSLWNN